MQPLVETAGTRAPVIAVGVRSFAAQEPDHLRVRIRRVRRRRPLCLFDPPCEGHHTHGDSTSHAIPGLSEDCAGEFSQQQLDRRRGELLAAFGVVCIVTGIFLHRHAVQSAGILDERRAKGRDIHVVQRKREAYQLWQEGPRELPHAEQQDRELQAGRRQRGMLREAARRHDVEGRAKVLEQSAIGKAVVAQRVGICANGVFEEPRQPRADLGVRERDCRCPLQPATIDECGGSELLGIMQGARCGDFLLTTIPRSRVRLREGAKSLEDKREMLRTTARGRQLIGQRLRSSLYRSDVLQDDLLRQRYCLGILIDVGEAIEGSPISAVFGGRVECWIAGLGREPESCGLLVWRGLHDAGW